MRCASAATRRKSAGWWYRRAWARPGRMLRDGASRIISDACEDLKPGVRQSHTKKGGNPFVHPYMQWSGRAVTMEERSPRRMLRLSTLWREPLRWLTLLLVPDRAVPAAVARAT